MPRWGDDPSAELWSRPLLSRPLLSEPEPEPDWQPEPEPEPEWELRQDSELQWEPEPEPEPGAASMSRPVSPTLGQSRPVSPNYGRSNSPDRVQQPHRIHYDDGATPLVEAEAADLHTSTGTGQLVQLAVGLAKVEAGQIQDGAPQPAQPPA
eukprot:COSAG04_NODE_4362_length_2137_cov_1.555937_1_plen_152_part_00